MSIKYDKSIVSVCFLILVFFGNALQADVEKKAVTHDDYDSWMSISGEKISNDGKWLLFLETPQEGEAFLVVKHISSGKEFRHTIGFTGEGTTAHRAAGPEFSHGLDHVAFLISPSQDEIKAAKKEKKKENPHKKLGIMSLVDGTVEVIEDVKEFKMPEEADWIAFLKEEAKKTPEKKEDALKKETAEKKAEPEKKLTPEEEKAKKIEAAKKEKKKDGTSLVFRSLTDGTEKTFELVLDFHVLKNGKHLFYVISSKETPEKDGLFVYTPGGESAPLLTGEGNYVKLAVDKKETHLAFLTNRDDYKADEPTFNLYGWKNGDKAASLWVSHTATDEFPQGMSVSDKSDISFSEDAKMVLFGIKEIPEPEKDEEDGEEKEKARFDLWHWDDPYPQPQQKIMAERVKNNTYECILNLDSMKFVQLADKDLPDVELSPDGKTAWAQNSWPYAKLVSWDSTYSDIYVVDNKTAKRTLVRKKLYGRASLSPGGGFITWFENGHWYAYNIAEGSTANLTEKLDVRFDREDHDTPNPAYPYGLAGWLEDDASVLIYDQFDIWEVKGDGSGARMITEGVGRKNNISFRNIRLDREERFISPTSPLLLSASNTETMASGFYSDSVKGSKPPVELMMMDKSVRLNAKAKDADVVLVSFQSFDQFPDIYASDLSFKTTNRMTEYGKQTERFIWGREELRSFSSSDGKPLKGILIKPENFDPEKKYPLMVYIYETLHQGFHRFRNPGPGTSINPSYYVSNGYVLWMPDIEYDTGYPGRDALKCVLPGIQMLIREGIADPDAIGIQGHSWGGYQIAYMVTQTNIFAAAEAGAPVSNMISAYGGIRWGSGMSREFQYERTQSRLGDTLWQVPMRYIENSPIFWADKVKTPLLMIHNDKDGAVPWYQGIEYIMALRRLGREAYMFNYLGEDHGLRKRVNQKDFTIRMQEFFDHHLKGSPAPDWMKNGIKAWDKETQQNK